MSVQQELEALRVELAGARRHAERMTGKDGSDDNWRRVRELDGAIRQREMMLRNDASAAADADFERQCQLARQGEEQERQRALAALPRDAWGNVITPPEPPSRTPREEYERLRAVNPLHSAEYLRRVGAAAIWPEEGK